MKSFWFENQLIERDYFPILAQNAYISRFKLKILRDHGYCSQTLAMPINLLCAIQQRNISDQYGRDLATPKTNQLEQHLSSRN